MTTCEICGIVIALYIVIVLYSIGMAVVAHMFANFEIFENTFSENERIFYSLCWPLAIIFLSLYYLIKKIKLNIKLKETNKIEKYRRKKELVDNILKELNIR